MTFDQIIVIREGTWNWVYYLGFVVIFGSFIFFVVCFLKSLKLLRDRRFLAQLAAQDGKSFAVNFSIWQNFLIWLLMIPASSFVLWIFFQDCFNGFTSAQFAEDKIRLNYLWPMPDKEFSRVEIQKVESKYWGKNSRVLIITTTAGRKIKSVSGDADDIRGLDEEFLRALGVKPQKN